jgi:CBS-domain-containing membrane protein
MSRIPLRDTESQSSLGRPVAYLNGSVAAHPPVVRVRPQALAQGRIALSDPAVRVVTDFAREHAVTVAEDRPIDEAMREMIVAGVRALLVVHGDMVTGLITSYDIQGERPLQFLRSSNFSRHDEIEVGHIMTPWDQVPTLDWQAVRTECVADIVKFFKNTRATHGVILEYLDQGGIFVRGLISRTQLERQLGYSIYH